MDLAELTALLTPEGLRLLDEISGIDSADDVARTVSRLRAAGHSPELVSAVVGQARLRTRARAKFGPFAERMLFTRAGLEQATRLSIAGRHAARFRDAGMTSVADLGCGIGGDALGLAALGLKVVAVDADEVTAAIAAYNLAPFGEDVVVRHARAEEVTDAAASGIPQRRRVLARPRPPDRRALRDLAHAARGLVAVARLGLRPRRAASRGREARPGARSRAAPRRRRGAVGQRRGLDDRARRVDRARSRDPECGGRRSSCAASRRGR